MTNKEIKQCREEWESSQTHAEFGYWAWVDRWVEKLIAHVEYEFEPVCEACGDMGIVYTGSGCEDTRKPCPQCQTINE